MRITPSSATKISATISGHAADTLMGLQTRRAQSSVGVMKRSILACFEITTSDGMHLLLSKNHSICVTQAVAPSARLIPGRGASAAGVKFQKVRLKLVF